MPATEPNNRLLVGHSVDIHALLFSCTFISDAHALNQYIGGSGLIYFDEFQCTGRETLLVNCSTGFKKACSHYNDVGVSCPSGEHFQYHFEMVVTSVL